MSGTEASPSTDSFTEGGRIERVFKALASRPRREILAFLVSETTARSGGCCSADDVCACDLTERLGLGAPTVSHHMKVLLEAELVTARKSGQWVHYRLQEDTVRQVIDALEPLAGAGGPARSPGA